MNEARHNTAPGSPLLHRRGRRWTHWVAALLIFCFGVAVGAGGTVRLIHRKIVRHYEQPPGHEVGLIMRRLDRKLDLRDDQHARIQEIVERRLDALRDIRDEALPRVRAELRAAREEIEAELDPSQGERFHRTLNWYAGLLPPVPAAGTDLPENPDPP